MYAKKFNFIDYNGVEREETHYFNLNETEISMWELSTEGGLADMLKRIIAAKDGPAIMREFEKLIEKSYGVKSDDGRRLMKSPEIFRAFKETEAYNQLFMELIGSTDACSEFVNKVMPKAKNDDKAVLEVIDR